MQYNYSKLLGAIREISSTHSVFAAQLGISERSLSLKLNNKREWKQNEIVKVFDILSIPYEQIPLYFFNVKVQ